MYSPFPSIKLILVKEMQAKAWAAVDHEVMVLGIAGERTRRTLMSSSGHDSIMGCTTPKNEHYYAEKLLESQNEVCVDWIPHCRGRVKP